MNYTDIHVVDTFEEAEQFRYEHNDQPVEIGTAVGYDRPFMGMLDVELQPGGLDSNNKPVMQLVCFDGIYFQSES